MTELERIIAARLGAHRRCPCQGPLTEDELIEAHGWRPARFDRAVYRVAIAPDAGADEAVDSPSHDRSRPIPDRQNGRSIRTS